MQNHRLKTSVSNNMRRAWIVQQLTAAIAMLLWVLSVGLKLPGWLRGLLVPGGWIFYFGGLAFLAAAWYASRSLETAHQRPAPDDSNTR